MKNRQILHIVPLLLLAGGIEVGLLTLADWQKNRYHQRLTEQAAFQSRPSVTVTGEWLPEATFALTNQPHPRAPEAELGWRILTPLRTASGTLLVDRGYTSPRYQADQSPDFSTLAPQATSATVSGIMQTFPQRKGWLQGPDTTTHPRLLAFLNPALITSETQTTYLISRTPTSEHILAVPPPLPAPTKHLSYALQWLGMALAFPLLCAGTWVKGRRRKA